LTNQLPGNLDEIFPLRLRLSREFRFFQSGDEVIAERVEDGQRFSVRRWQYEMFLRFDGKRSFEEAAREVYQQAGGGFTAVGLLNFYRWLYQEDLVLCECESVFELVADEEENLSDLSLLEGKQEEVEESFTRPRFGTVMETIDGMLPGKDWQKRAIKISAMVFFGLSILRLGYVTAPVFEPPLNRLYAGVESYFYSGEKPVQVESIRAISDSPQKEVKLAGRVEPSMPEPPAFSPPVVEESADDVNLQLIEDLRRRMSECRIRRDEFYIQNNEAGYREEVEKMSEIAREIGEIESRL
jgi:hypothetical protein